MVRAPVLRQLFVDGQSMWDYLDGRIPTYDEVTRRLFVAERSIDPRLPDHHYKAGMTETLESIGDISGLVTTGLSRLGEKHLNLEGEKVFVQSGEWSDWHELLTFCPPLPVISAFIWSKAGYVPKPGETAALRDFTKRLLEPNFRHTCLPAPRFTFLEAFIKEHGLCDLHVHLSGSTETDIAWQNFLKDPHSIYFECEKAFNSVEIVREQYAQEGLTAPFRLYQLLVTAKNIRRTLIESLFPPMANIARNQEFKGRSISEILSCHSPLRTDFPEGGRHPMLEVFDRPDEKVSDYHELVLEALTCVLVVDRIYRTRNRETACLFHAYLLIQGFFNKFIVQQVVQNGFGQFQKIASNDFRAKPEKSYRNRFHQLNGNDGDNILMIEGRFAPRADVPGNIRLLEKIIGGWNDFTGKDSPSANPTGSPDRNAEAGILSGSFGNQTSHGIKRPTLTLVCHFIKSPDKSKIDSESVSIKIRHGELRLSIYKKARALIKALEEKPVFRAFFSGIDAANNELDAPPEVFAPIYRYLRSKGVRNFTFHVGEDFHHLVGGMRAIYEAVTFLALGDGNRIGHGTAVGIDPLIWSSVVGEEIFIKEGEWLDDILFAIHIIEKEPEAGLSHKLPELRSEAEDLAFRVYGRHYPLSDHLSAWQARRYCPYHLLLGEDEAKSKGLFVSTEAEEIRKSLGRENSVKDILLDYHREKVRSKYECIKRLKTTKLFTITDLIKLQNQLVSELHDKNIVIESLPTSNVRISFYNRHKQHHLWRWLGIADDNLKFTNKPIVVLGTDDTGIFATNIRNEYCHVWSNIKSLGSYDESVNAINLLHRNSLLYRFATTKTPNQ